jgi:hypothetical protein
MTLRAALVAAGAAFGVPVVSKPEPTTVPHDRIAELGRFLMERDMVALPPGVARNVRRSFRRRLLGSTAATAVPK